MSYNIRAWLTYSEEILANETGEPADGHPVRKLAIVCVLKNPYAGRFSHDLSLLVSDSPALGAEVGRRLSLLAGVDAITSYGKACVVGVEGEYEHGNALLTSAFADPVRDAVGGVKPGFPQPASEAGRAPPLTFHSLIKTRCMFVRTMTPCRSRFMTHRCRERSQ